MTTAFACSALGALVLFVVTWGTTSTEFAALGTLAALGGTVVAVTTSFFSISASLPSEEGLDVVEAATLGALLVGSLPFFLITQTRAPGALGGVAAAGTVTLAAGLAFVAATTLWAMFLAFEALLLSAIYILLLTSKSERARDAALEMLVWTLVGSAGLLTGFGLLGGGHQLSTAPAR